MARLSPRPLTAVALAVVGAALAAAPAQATPTASFTHNPEPAVTRAQVNFDASASQATTQFTITAYHWDFGDGVTADTTVPTTTHTYADAQHQKSHPYTASLTVTDGSPNNPPANSSTSPAATQTVTITDRSPTAAFTAPASAPPGTDIQFDGATHSSDPDGSIAAGGYSWDFGDNSPPGTGPTPTHRYAAEGDHTVTLTVTDDSGNTGMVSATIVDRPPDARFAATPSSPATQQAVGFDAGATTDPDGSVIAYRWDFGDGATATGVQASHSYARAGTYTVALTATDGAGRSSTTSAPLRVADRPPVASFSFAPASPVERQTVGFDASASADPDGTIPANGYLWDFGDGSPVGSGQRTTHAYAQAGTYTVRLAVYDDSGSGTSAPPQTVVVSVPDAGPASSGQLASSGLGSGAGPASPGGSGGLGEPFTPPPVRLGHLRVSRSGAVAGTLICPVVAGTCRGRVSLFSVPTGRGRSSAARNELSLGAASFRARGGSSSLVRLHISHRLLRLLARAGRISVRAYAVSRDAAGDTSLAEAGAVYRR